MSAEKPLLNPEDIPEEYTQALIEHEDFEEPVRHSMREAGASEQQIDLVTALGRRGRELRLESRHDALTGILNRRGMQEVLDNTAAQAKRETKRQAFAEAQEGENGAAPKPEQEAKPGMMAFVLLDLENFKPINDTFGHERGDEILSGVTTAMTEELRPGDAVARIGGDEFALLLKNVRDPEQVYEILERLGYVFPKRPGTDEPMRINPDKLVIEMVPSDEEAPGKIKTLLNRSLSKLHK
jgi:GGDEF domain-containing protein